MNGSTLEIFVSDMGNIYIFWKVLKSYEELHSKFGEIRVVVFVVAQQTFCISCDLATFKNLYLANQMRYPREIFFVWKLISRAFKKKYQKKFYPKKFVLIGALRQKLQIQPCSLPGVQNIKLPCDSTFFELFRTQIKFR